MTIAIIPILVAVILLALLWYVCDQFVTDAFVLKVLRVVMVVLVVLWIVSILSGAGPGIVFTTR